MGGGFIAVFFVLYDETAAKLKDERIEECRLRQVSNCLDSLVGYSQTAGVCGGTVAATLISTSDWGWLSFPWNGGGVVCQLEDCTT